MPWTGAPPPAVPARCLGRPGAAVDAIHRAESAVALQDWPRAWGPSLTALFVAERDFLPGEDAPWIDQTRHQLTELRRAPWRAIRQPHWASAAPSSPARSGPAGSSPSLAPLRESGYRYLMQALAAQGNLAEALGVYSQLRECLRDQLGVSPSPATRELYQRLLAA